MTKPALFEAARRVVIGLLALVVMLLWAVASEAHLPSDDTICVDGRLYLLPDEALYVVTWARPVLNEEGLQVRCSLALSPYIGPGMSDVSDSPDR